MNIYESASNLLDRLDRINSVISEEYKSPPNKSYFDSKSVDELKKIYKQLKSKMKKEFSSDLDDDMMHVARLIVKKGGSDPRKSSDKDLEIDDMVDAIGNKNKDSKTLINKLKKHY